MTAEALARALLDAGAVALRPDDPFTWVSGLRAPIYCDNRRTLAFPDLRAAVADALTAEARPMAPDVVVGVATAGIPQATLVADRLALPLAYVRAAPKVHGRGNRLEGRLKAGQRAVLVEDLVSTGGSSLAAAHALRDAGVRVAAVLCVFSYGLAAAKRAFAEANLVLRPLATLGDLLAVAEHTAALAPDARAALLDWQQDPEAWSARVGG